VTDALEPTANEIPPDAETGADDDIPIVEPEPGPEPEPMPEPAAKLLAQLERELKDGIIEAGHTFGDLVVRVDGQAVRGWDELRVAVRQVRVGRAIPVVVVRGGREVTVSITPTDQSSASK